MRILTAPSSRFRYAVSWKGRGTGSGRGMGRRWAGRAGDGREVGKGQRLVFEGNEVAWEPGKQG